MLEQTKKNFTTGVARLKWIAGFLTERAKAETSLAKMSFEKNRLQNSIDQVYCSIGKRVLAIQESGSSDVFSDPLVLQSLGEVKELEEKLRDLGRHSDAVHNAKA